MDFPVSNKKYKQKILFSHLLVLFQYTSLIPNDTPKLNAVEILHIDYNLPASTWPITTNEIWIFSFPMAERPACCMGRALVNLRRWCKLAIGAGLYLAPHVSGFASNGRYTDGKAIFPFEVHKFKKLNLPSMSTSDDFSPGRTVFSKLFGDVRRARPHTTGCSFPNRLTNSISETTQNHHNPT